MAKIEVDDAGPPLDATQLDAAEIQLGLKFPEPYRAFMLKFNGGTPDPSGYRIKWNGNQKFGRDWRTSDIDVIYSIAGDADFDLINENLVTFRNRIPVTTFTIGSDSSGNQVLLAVGGENAGRVLFWLMDEEVEEGAVPDFRNCGHVAASFEEFLKNLFD